MVRPLLTGSPMTNAVPMDETEVLTVEVEVLRGAHREMDERIRLLETESPGDIFAIRRLKKEKLVLKDRLRVLEDRLLPDIIA